MFRVQQSKTAWRHVCCVLSSMIFMCQRHIVLFFFLLKVTVTWDWSNWILHLISALLNGSSIKIVNVEVHIYIHKANDWFMYTTCFICDCYIVGLILLCSDSLVLHWNATVLIDCLVLLSCFYVRDFIFTSLQWYWLPLII